MKAMFMSDLLIAKKYLVTQIFLGLVIGVFMCISMQNIYVIPPVMSALIPFSIAFTVLAYDERGGWEQFRLALPLSRKSIIAGRYASFAVVALVGVATGVVIAAVIAAAALLLPSVPQLAVLMEDFSWPTIVLASVAGVAIIIVMLAVILPMVSRFGMTKAVRFVPLVMIFGTVFLFNIGGNSAASELMANVAAWIETPQGVAGMSAVVIVIVAALYALSCALSVKLYERREL